MRRRHFALPGNWPRALKGRRTYPGRGASGNHMPHDASSPVSRLLIGTHTAAAPGRTAAEPAEPAKATAPDPATLQQALSGGRGSGPASERAARSMSERGRVCGSCPPRHPTPLCGEVLSGKRRPRRPGPPRPGHRQVAEQPAELLHRLACDDAAAKY